MSLSSSFAGSKKRPHLLSVLSSDPSPPVCFARSSLATGLDLAAFTPCSPTKKKAKTKSRRTVRFASTTKSTLSADSEPPHCVFHECSNYHPEMTEEDRLRVRNSIWYTVRFFSFRFLLLVLIFLYLKFVALRTLNCFTFLSLFVLLYPFHTIRVCNCHCV